MRILRRSKPKGYTLRQLVTLNYQGSSSHTPNARYRLWIRADAHDKYQLFRLQSDLGRMIFRDNA